MYKEENITRSMLEFNTLIKCAKKFGTRLIQIQSFKFFIFLSTQNFYMEIYLGKKKKGRKKEKKRRRGRR